MEKNQLNPLALGYTIAILGAISYLVLRLLVRLTGIGSWALVVFKGLIFSFNKTSTIWIIPEVIQVTILGFIGGYLIASLYNKFS
jgi:hypothetical protein